MLLHLNQNYLLKQQNIEKALSSRESLDILYQKYFFTIKMRYYFKSSADISAQYTF